MKRWRMIISFLAVLLLAWLALQFAQNVEPRHQGRTLTQWLEEAHHAAFNSNGDPNAPAVIQASAVAVKQIGTNAIPFLLKKLAMQESSMHRPLESLLRLQTFFHIQLQDKRTERDLGIEGFYILQTNAITALPALIKLTNHQDSDVRYRALYSLSCIHPEPEAFLLILRRTIHDYAVDVRRLSATFLSDFYPEEAEKANVYHEFPELNPANTNKGSTFNPVWVPDK